MPPLTKSLRLFTRALLLAAIPLFAGCIYTPRVLPIAEQTPVDRQVADYPTGFELRPYITHLTSPAAMVPDEAGNLLIAQGAGRDDSPAVFGFRPDGTRFDIYPLRSRVRIPFLSNDFRIYGPVGGMALANDKIYVSHRDRHGKGVITAFGYDGSHATVVADLPAQGDYSVTDIAINPVNGRIFFGLGAATNSGVVGPDNATIGWTRAHPTFCDIPSLDYRLLGIRFQSHNPQAGIFGPPDIAVTGPFQPYDVGNKLHIDGSRNDRPTSAVFSVSPTGGDLRVEAHGIRLPRGLAFNEFYSLYATNDGMELRGSRPVKDDPDSLIRIIPGAAAWYGFPDYCADGHPITEPRFQPGVAFLTPTGLPELTMLIDHAASNIVAPDHILYRAIFPSLSGAAKMAFAPSSGPFSEFAGTAIVALAGNRAPFATSGQKLVGASGFRVVRVDVERQTVKDFVRNTDNKPAHLLKPIPPDALERPCDIKFSYDQKTMYILDQGQFDVRDGKDIAKDGTGKVYILTAVKPPATRPAATQPAAPH